MLNFFMPTRVLCGIDCLKDHSNVFTKLGSRAFIVTGKKSSAQNGSLNDVRFILEQNNIHYTLYNEINIELFAYINVFLYLCIRKSS